MGRIADPYKSRTPLFVEGVSQIQQIAWGSFQGTIFVQLWRLLCLSLPEQ